MSSNWNRFLSLATSIALFGCSESHPGSHVESRVEAGLTLSPIVIDDAVFQSLANCPGCLVSKSRPVVLPLTRQTFIDAKVVDPGGHSAGKAVSVDAVGRAVNSSVLLAAEAAAVNARQGKLRDDVYALSQTGGSDLIPVGIWADVQVHFPPKEQLLADSTFRAADTKQRLTEIGAVTSKITNWLDAHGYPTYDRGTSSPGISADVPASALVELGKLDGIAVVSYRPKGAPNGTAWFDNVKTTAAHSIIGSVAGQGFCNSEGTQPDYYAYLNVPASHIAALYYPDPHTTWTTELIASTYPPTMAPSAPPYIGDWYGFNGGTGTNVEDTWEWCWSQGISAMNRSYSFDSYTPGGPGHYDFVTDYQVKSSPWPFITNAAGNCEDDYGNFIDCTTAPGWNYTVSRGYNLLVVGGADDHNQNNTTMDTLATFSAYTNPTTTHNDFELPNMVAPAVCVDSTSYYCGTGTSAAAPITLGAALLARARDISYMAWPEMTRSSIMATSTAPIDQYGRTLNLSANAGDRMQGAGLLNSKALVTLADPANHVGPLSTARALGHFAKSYTFSTDFTNGLSNDAYNIRTGTTGRLRVAIAWDASATGCSITGWNNCSGETLDADLDLYVYQLVGNQWNLVCSSWTFDSSWEICDLPVNSGQTYKAQLRLWTTSAPSTYLGISWYNYTTASEQ